MFTADMEEMLGKRLTVNGVEHVEDPHTDDPDDFDWDLDDRVTLTDVGWERARAERSVLATRKPVEC
jgi:hypothetical protein